MVMNSDEIMAVDQKAKLKTPRAAGQAAVVEIHDAADDGTNLQSGACFQGL